MSLEIIVGMDGKLKSFNGDISYVSFDYDSNGRLKSVFHSKDGISDKYSKHWWRISLDYSSNGNFKSMTKAGESNEVDIRFEP